MTTDELTPVAQDVTASPAAPEFSPGAQWIWGGDDPTARNQWR